VLDERGEALVVGEQLPLTRAPGSVQLWPSLNPGTVVHLRSDYQVRGPFES
jgi:hypothetical protein